MLRCVIELLHIFLNCCNHGYISIIRDFGRLSSVASLLPLSCVNWPLSEIHIIINYSYVYLFVYCFVYETNTFVLTILFPHRGFFLLVKNIEIF